MVEYEVSVEVARAPEDVFAFVAAFDRMPAWAPGIVAAGVDGGAPPGEGARGYEVRRFLGRRVASTWELADWDPPRGFTMAFAARSVEGDGRFRFEPVAGGTRVTVAARVQGWSFLAPLFRREDRKILGALKRELERGG